jgi:hypothetical protein
LIRQLDWLWCSNGRLYLLLAEADRTVGEAMLNRLEKETLWLFATSATRADTRMAVFPEDGVTFGALVGAVEAAPSLVDIRATSEGFGEDSLVAVRTSLSRQLAERIRSRAAPREHMPIDDLRPSRLGDKPTGFGTDARE